MRFFGFLAVLPLALAKEASSARRHPHLESGSAPQSFVNTAVARIVELGGSTATITTQYNVKALVDDPGPYILALGGKNSEVPAWYEVQIGGKAVNDVVVDTLLDAPVAIIPVGNMKKDESVTISLNSVAAHATEPLPPAIKQTDSQFTIWNTASTLVDSAYTSDVERVKIRSPTPQILSHGKVSKKYTRDSEVTKSGATLTLGPFHAVPPTIGNDAKAEQSPFHVHYQTTTPIIGIRKLRRSAEVSHWGNNLNIQDEVELFNDGPELMGQFSRLAHQQSKYHSQSPAQILADFSLRLPPSAHSVYYYDTIGNVSTSHFRPGSAGSAGTSRRRVVDSLLELRPRYPILGGWNYSFTVGWDSPLGDALKEDATGKKFLAVPFITPMPGVVTDEVELKIVLPDGASDVEVFTPFPVDSFEHSLHKTYLDTTGRPVVTLTKALVTENHAQPVYVTYTYSTSAQLQKPLMVSAVVGALLFAFMLLRRVNYNIDKEELKKRE